MRDHLSLILIVVLGLAAAAPADAQQDMFQIPADGQFTVGVRFIHPYFDTQRYDLYDAPPPEFDFLSGVFDIYATLPFSARWSAVIDVPYLRFSLESRDDVETAFGNVYLGARYYRLEADRSRTFHLGLTVPTSQKDDRNRLAWAAIVNYHEIYKYVPGGLCGYFATAHDRYTPGGLILGYELGAMLMIPTAYENDEADFFFRYGALFGYRESGFDVRAGIMGLFMMSADTEEFSDQFWTDFMIKASLTRGLVRPSVFYRIPLQSDVQDVLNAALGLQLEFAFGG